MKNTEIVKMTAKDIRKTPYFRRMHTAAIVLLIVFSLLLPAGWTCCLDTMQRADEDMAELEISKAAGEINETRYETKASEYKSTHDFMLFLIIFQTLVASLIYFIVVFNLIKNTKNPEDYYVYEASCSDVEADFFKYRSNAFGRMAFDVTVSFRDYLGERIKRQEKFSLNFPDLKRSYSGVTVKVAYDSGKKRFLFIETLESKMEERSNGGAVV